MGGIPKRAETVTAALERIDVSVWARKSVRECVAIAARASKHRGKGGIDPVRLDAVLALLVRDIEAERRALAQRGALQA